MNKLFNLQGLQAVFRQMLVEQRYMQPRSITLSWKKDLENYFLGLCVSYNENFKIPLDSIHPYDLYKNGFVPANDNDSLESFRGRFNRKSQTSAFLKASKRFVDFFDKLKIYKHNE